MNNQELSVLWQLCLGIAERNPRFTPRDRDGLARWISQQLKDSLDLETCSVCSAYLALDQSVNPNGSHAPSTVGKNGVNTRKFLAPVSSFWFWYMIAMFQNAFFCLGISVERGTLGQINSWIFFYFALYCLEGIVISAFYWRQRQLFQNNK